MWYTTCLCKPCLELAKNFINFLLLWLWWWRCTQELHLVLVVVVVHIRTSFSVVVVAVVVGIFREVPHGSCIAARSWCGAVGIFDAWRSELQYFGTSSAKRTPSLVGCSGFAWLGSHQALASSCSSAPNFCSRDCWTHSSIGIFFFHQSHCCRQRRRPFHYWTIPSMSQFLFCWIPLIMP